MQPQSNTRPGGMKVDDQSILAALFGGGGLAGVAVTKGFDYLKSRRRAASGDRRQAEHGWGNLIDRLEKRLEKTEKQAEAAELRSTDCEHRHAHCEATVTVVMGALNETRGKLGLPPISADLNEAQA